MSNKLKLYPVEKFSSIREMLALAEKEAPDTYAFKYKPGEKTASGDPVVVSVTYKEFVNTTRAIGTALYERGYHGGVHVACIGENSYNWVCVYLSTLAGDNVFVPIDKELPLAELLNVLRRSGSTVVFCTAKFEKIINENKAQLPDIKLTVRTDNSEFTDLIAEGEAELKKGCRGYLDSHSGEYDMKMLVYTSGTTGLSKGVMLSEHNLVSSVYYGLQVSTIYDTGLSILPYHHTYEAVCSLLVSLHHHSTICINDSVRAVLQNFKLFKPTHVYLVPALAEMFYKRIWRTVEEQGKGKQLKMLISVSNGLRKVGIDARRTLFKTIHDTFGGRLRKIVCGGAPIRPEVNKFFDDIGISLINGYGITECSPLVAANREECNTYNTAGLKLPCIDIKIDNPDEFGNGEICVKGDVVMLGYYNDPERTAEVLQDGWFRTGDYGHLNDLGQITITGRKKNIIVLNNGKNIYPEEIEEYIMIIPYVNEVVVYATKDEDGNQNGLCAEAYLDEQKLTEMGITEPEKRFKADVFEALKDLPVYKQVGTVVLRKTEFEKNSSRKIKRSLIGNNK